MASKPHEVGGKPEFEPGDHDERVAELAIRASDLLPGDILLFHSLSKQPQAAAISKATNSPYTHAAIYIGSGQIAESDIPKVRVRKLTDADFTGSRIGVLRSQMVFSKKRAAEVRTFLENLVAKKAHYDFKGITTFTGKQKNFQTHLLSELAANYGKITTEDEFLKQPYFCSALVVACYTIAGVIGDTAQVAYPPDIFSPGDLHRDPTFGWVLGFIVPQDSTVPADDPLLTQTLWKDNHAARWWS